MKKEERIVAPLLLSHLFLSKISNFTRNRSFYNLFNENLKSENYSYTSSFFAFSVPIVRVI